MDMWIPLALVHPSALAIGLAEVCQQRLQHIAVGLRHGFSDRNLPSFYPAEGASNVPLQWDGGETPIPQPELPAHLGYPSFRVFGCRRDRRSSGSHWRLAGQITRPLKQPCT